MKKTIGVIVVKILQIILQIIGTCCVGMYIFQKVVSIPSSTWKWMGITIIVTVVVIIVWIFTLVIALKNAKKRLKRKGSRCQKRDPKDQKH